MANNVRDEKTPTYISPDYGQMIKQQTNGAIVEAFTAALFDRRTKFNVKTLITMFRNLIIMLLVKSAVEDTKGYVDTFKFTSMNPFKFFIQRVFKVKHVNFVIARVSGEKSDAKATDGKVTDGASRWMYEGKYLNTNLLKNYMEKKSVYIDQPGQYYINSFGYLIKINVTANSIAFIVPDLQNQKYEVESNIIRNSVDISFGSKTQVLKCSATSIQSPVPQFEPLAYSVAFETDNYCKLKRALDRYFIMNDEVSANAQPYTINFDGPPGTGKTTFCSYIAASGIFDVCVIVNMLQFTKNPFSSFLSSFKSKIDPMIKEINGKQPKLLIMFDEIDKWIDSHIENHICDLRDKSKVSKQSTGSGGDGKNGGQTVIENIKEMTLEEENDERRRRRHEFFDTLLMLIDGNIYPSNRTYVFIFNTNHYDKLFDMEKLHEKYHALVNRFERYTFALGEKKDIVKYFDNVRSRLRETLLKTDITNEKSEQIKQSLNGIIEAPEDVYDGIPTDIKLSYRDLHKNFRASGFDIMRTISIISNNHKNPGTVNAISKCIELN